MSRRGGNSDGVGTDRRVDWSRDIEAPRQEVSVLSMLYEGHEIQQHLDGADIHTVGFIKFYNDERERYRKKSTKRESSPKQTYDLTDEIAHFGAQAAAAARHTTRTRALLHHAGPDRKGAIADTAAAINRAGGNIEGAQMSVVAGYLITTFLVSGLDEAPEGLPKDLMGEFRKLKLEDVDWPRPDSTCWHARGEDVPGAVESGLVLALTEAIRKRELPLVMLHSWRDADTQKEMVDLNFAMAPDPEQSEPEVVAEIESAVAASLPNCQLDIFPSAWPEYARPRESDRDPTGRERDVLVTVCNHARPGFVHDVLKTLSEDQAIERVRGSSMAILEGATVLTVVVEPAEHASFNFLKRDVHMRIGAIKGAKAQVEVNAIGEMHPLEGEELDDADSLTTHELRLQVLEQPGVVEKVARLLQGEDVNITWFVCRVQEPQVGSRWQICDIQMQLAVREAGSLEKLSRELRALTKSEGWDEATLNDFTLGH